MKRSEMIKNLALGLSYVNARYSTDDTHEDVAGLLLKLIEEAGMLPPETVRYTDQDNGNTLCSPENAWDEDRVSGAV